MDKKLSYGSLFAGAGGFDLGFDAAGLECRWQVEIDPTARAVLGRHWPDVPKFDDVHDVGKRNLSRVDVICGGSPCQSFSVAGKRAGTEGTSNLFREMVRVCAELKPSYVVWENVPGVFSGFDEVDDATDPDGRRHCVDDGSGESLRSWWMGSVLGAFSDIGFDGAWRVLSAEHFGVPQRRRRVFAVFARQSRGHSGAERCREILALTPSVRRDHPPGRQAREGLAYCLTASAGHSSSRVGQAHNTKCRAGSPDEVRGTANLIPTISPAVTAKWAKGSGGPAGDECQNLVAFAQNQRDEVRNLNGLAGALAAEPGMKQQTYIAHMLTANGFDASEDGTGRGTVVGSLHARNSQNGHGASGTNNQDVYNGHIVPTFNASDYASGQFEEHDLARPLTTSPDRSRAAPLALVPTAIRTANTSSNGCGLGQDTAYTLDSADGQAVGLASGVRRLSPVECEKLMSWPPNHTKYRADGSEIADGPRYKLCGNGVVSNVAEFIARRLIGVDEMSSDGPFC